MYFAKFNLVIVLYFIFSNILPHLEASEDEDETGQTRIAVKSLKQYEKEFEQIFSSYCTSRCLGETIAKESLQILVSSFLENHPTSKDKLRDFPGTLSTFDIKYVEALNAFILWFQEIINSK